MDAREVLEEHKGVFVNRDCLFVSTTGKLLTGYVNCEVIYPYYPIVRDLVGQLLDPFLDEVEGFVCPAVGDIVLLQYATIMANELGRLTVAAWADKHDENTYRVERNGYGPAIRGKRVLVLNDRISNGGTTLKVIAAARAWDCEVVGVASLSSITAATAEMLGVPKAHTLAPIDVEAFMPDKIPAEFQGQPIAVDEPLGHGYEWQHEHPDYPGGFIKLLGTAKGDSDV